MVTLLACTNYNASVIVEDNEARYMNTLNEQKIRKALGGRPAGSECGNGCSCS